MSENSNTSANSNTQESSTEISKKKHKTNKNEKVPKSNWFEREIGFPAVPFIPPLRTEDGTTHSLSSDSRDKPVLPHKTSIAYRLERSYNWDQTKYDYLEKFHPIDKTLHSYSSSNGHPLAASCRNICEAYALTKAIRKLHNHGITHSMIGDVGGSAARHLAAKHRYVHSMCPQIISSDMHREPLPNSCHHKWLDCTCYKYDVTMSVHALYYIEPEDIFKSLAKQRLPIHYAVMHDYTDDPEELYLGEIKVRYQGPLMEVSPSGNNASYIHSYPQWVVDGYYPIRGTNKALNVYKVHTVGEDHLFEITIIKQYNRPKFVLKEQATLDNICKEAFPLGSTIEKYGIQKFVNKVADEASKTGHSRHEARRHAMDWLDTNIPVMSKSYRLSLETEDAIEYINTTLSTLTSRTGPLTRFMFHNRLLALVLAFALVWNMWYLEFETPVIDTTYFSPIVWMNLLIIFIAISISNRHLLNIKYAVIDYCNPLSDEEYDKDKCDYFPPVVHRDCSPKLRAYPMLMTKHHIPAYPRNCYHNYRSAILGRWLNKVAVIDKMWDLVKIPKVLVVAAEYIRSRLFPLEHEEWFSRFPVAKQKRLLREIELTFNINYCEDNDTKLFLKFEANKNVNKKARCIAAGKERLNFETGRWVIPMSELLAEVLDEFNEVYLPLSSHSETIAEYIDSMSHMAMNDFSSFDGTQKRRAHIILHEFYRLAGMPESVIQLMELDLQDVEIETSVGLKFHMRNCRLSGRGDTLLGNTVLNAIIMNHVFQDSLIKMIVKGDDSVLELAPDANLGLAESQLSMLGFQSKLNWTDKNNVEFCSKLLVPVKGGITMGPKIGRLLAKTFWCRHTNYTREQMETQFRGTIKGLWHDISFVPILRDLGKLIKGNEPVIINEYAISNKLEHQMSFETLEYYSQRYKIPVDLLANYRVDTTQFPIVLDDQLTSRICDIDWSEDDNLELLSVKRHFNHYDHLIGPIFEEVFKYTFGIWGVLMLGGFESFVNKTLYNLMMHFLLWNLPLPLAVMAHVYHNFEAKPLLSVLQTGPNVNHTMVKKNTKKNKNKQSKQKQTARQTQIQDLKNSLKPLVKSAVAQGLRGGGAYLGNVVAPGVGTGLGYNIGAGISEILGFGDYTVKNNSLKSAPQFGKGSNEIRIRKREFVGNFSGSTSFASSGYTINPGNTSLFPWLSGIANSYQQYRVNGMVFYFNSTSATALNSTNTALGTVMMGTNYDLSEPDYASKAEMLSSYFSNSSKPSEDLVHAIECDMRQRPVDVLYIDHGGENSDNPALYDLARFQLASEGMQASAVIGELWVSYDITLYKPKMYEGYGFSRISNGPWTAASPFGLILLEQQGRQVSVTGSGGYTTLNFSRFRGRTIQITIHLTGTSLSNVAFTPTLTNCGFADRFKLDTASAIGNGNISTAWFYTATILVSSDTGVVPSFELTNTSFTSGTPVSVEVTILDITQQ